MEPSRPRGGYGGYGPEPCPDKIVRAKNVLSQIDPVVLANQIFEICDSNEDDELNWTEVKDCEVCI